jgi:nucleotide-binding universal stress UspA family protein
MFRFKKLMVALNLDDLDTLLIQYVGFVAKISLASDIYFVHVSDSFDIPDEIKKIYPEILAPVDEAACDRMKEIVGQTLDLPDTRFHFKAKEGPLIGTLVTFTRDLDIDLLIAGHSGDDSPIGRHYSEKIARKAFCSVLIVPPDSRVHLKHILVASDFSGHSCDSIDVGCAFAKAAGLPSLDVLNGYRVPKGYYKTGKSLEEFTEVMRKNAEEKSAQCLARLDLQGVNAIPRFRLTENVIKGIQAYADETDASLIVIGARGRSGDIAAILLGSVTEGLIRRTTRPLLAVKKKGQGLNILEALYPSG